MELDVSVDRPDYAALHATPVAVSAEWTGAALRLTIRGVGHDVGVLLGGDVGDGVAVVHRRPDAHQLGIQVDVRGPRGPNAAEECRQALLLRIAQAMRDLEDVRAAAVAASKPAAP